MDTIFSLKPLLKKVLPWFAGVSLATAASVVSATPFPNPFPGAFEEDIDGTGLFIAGAANTIAVEIADTFDGFSTFGFFDILDPGTLIPIFDATDAAGDIAVIDFAAGGVFDFDDNSVQSLFTAPVSVMGFYLDIAGSLYYSVPGLNPFGADLMAAHYSTGTTDLNLLFYTLPPGTIGAAAPEVLSWQFLSELTPVVEVPVPATAALMLIGLLGLGWSRRTA